MAKPATVKQHSVVRVTQKIIEAYRHIEKYESTIDYNKIEGGCLDYIDLGCAIRAHRVIEVKPGSIIVQDGLVGRKEETGGEIVSGLHTVIPNMIVGWRPTSKSQLREVVNLPEKFDIAPTIGMSNHLSKFDKINEGDYVRVHNRIGVVQSKNPTEASVLFISGNTLSYEWKKVMKVKDQEVARKLFEENT